MIVGERVISRAIAAVLFGGQLFLATDIRRLVVAGEDRNQRTAIEESEGVVDGQVVAMGAGDA